MIESTDKNIDIWSEAADKAWEDLTETAREFWGEHGIPFEYGESYMYCEHGLLMDSYMHFENTFGEDHDRDESMTLEEEIKDGAYEFIDFYIGEIVDFYRKDNNGDDYNEDYSGVDCWVIHSTNTPAQEGGLLAILDNRYVGIAMMRDAPDKSLFMHTCLNFGRAMNLCYRMGGYQDDNITFITNPQQDGQDGYNLMRDRDMIAWMETTGKKLEEEGRPIDWILEEYQVASDPQYVRESDKLNG